MKGGVDGNQNVETSHLNFRLVSEEDKVCVYHNLENTRIYHQVDPQCIEITEEVKKRNSF